MTVAVMVPTVLLILPILALVAWLWWQLGLKVMEWLTPSFEIWNLKRLWRNMVRGGFVSGPFPLPEVGSPELRQQFGSWPLISPFLYWVELNRRREQELYRSEHFKHIIEQRAEYEAKFAEMKEKYGPQS